MTAKSILRETLINNNNSFDLVKQSAITKDVIKAMIEFANYHTQQAIEAICKKAKTHPYLSGVDKQSIINAYDLNSIK